MTSPELTLTAPALASPAMTVEAFEALLAQPENADRHLELIQGELVETMPTEKHSLIAGNAYFHMRVFVEPRGLGRVAFEVRRQIPGDSSNSFLADVEFTSAARALPVVERGPAYQMPDLVIEIQSPDDSIASMRAKASYYLNNGAKLVWLVLTLKRLVIVLTANGEDILTEADALEGGEVLPGFSLPVKELFVGV
jgi:Uma2 family endonuclease